MTTPAQLLAQRNEIDRQIAIANLEGLKAILARIKSGDVSTLADDLTALLPQLTADSTMGSPYQQALGLISNLQGNVGYFDREVAKSQALVDAQTEQS
ncbi:hypothetical protein WBP07_12840 [Novosphingobium sp. BL-8A]|uniref:hypothetical protein n=1 Tax=Novosphingobium sp. BL-8A TaxID=3127639 RepID=UPI003757C4D9